jgi:hypothetical protein
MALWCIWGVHWKSTYLRQFEGSIPLDIAPLIWKGWALEKCRFFFLDSGATQNSYSRRTPAMRLGKWILLPTLFQESWDALPPSSSSWVPLGQCKARVWSMLAHLFHLSSLDPAVWMEVTTIWEWLSKCITCAMENHRKEELSVVALVCRIHDEVFLWRMAGASFPSDPGWGISRHYRMKQLRRRPQAVGLA